MSDSKEKMAKWLEEHVTDYNCPVCQKSDQYDIKDPAVLIYPDNFKPGEALVISTSGANYDAVLPVICQKCGYLRLFSAKVMGLVS